MNQPIKLLYICTMNRYILCIIFLTVLRLGCLRKPSNPPLRLRNTPLLRNPHDQKWLFVFGTGRSGSTTLKNMLNQVPGIYIGGENNNFMAQLYHTYTIFSEDYSENTKRRIDNTDAWGYFPRDDAKMRKAIQNVLLAYIGNYTNDYNIIGFKEVRYFDIGLIHDIFPNARFIFNWRQNITQQLQSLESHFEEVVNALSGSKEDKWRYVVPLIEYVCHDTWIFDQDYDTIVSSLQRLGISHEHFIADIHACGYKDILHNKTNPERLKRLMRDYITKHNALYNRLSSNTTYTFGFPLEEFSVNAFNKLLKWAGVQGCQYIDILHSNKNGFEHESKKVLEGTCYFEY